jgi:hypothetical protein
MVKCILQNSPFLHGCRVIYLHLCKCRTRIHSYRCKFLRWQSVHQTEGYMRKEILNLECFCLPDNLYKHRQHWNWVQYAWLICILILPFLVSLSCMHGVHVSNLYISTHFVLEILFTETLRFLNQNEFTEFANAPDQ